MNRLVCSRTASCLLSWALLAACGSPPPPEAPPAPTEDAGAPPVAVAPAPVEAPKPAEPTPEQKKKAEEKRQLEELSAKIEADNKAEVARWTPEMHKEAEKLASKAYPSGKAAITAALAGKHRKPTSAERDKYRHPVESLEFWGFKPTMTVLEYGPGEGWYTELLAPALAKKGKLIVTSSDPNGPADQRSTYYGKMLKHFLDKAPEVYGKVQTVIVDGSAPPKLGLDGTVDMVLLTRELHGLETSGKLVPWLTELRAALKPKGILAIEQHRAAPGANPDESAKNGYVPEKWVIEQVEAAGFKLAGKSEINANPKDTKDYAEGVWALPPSFRMKEKDHDKYAAIGESDRMTLKFVKVEKAEKPAAPATKAAATPKK